MSFLYRGWFPYPIIPVSQINPSFITESDQVAGFSLSTLAKLFWFNKGYDFTASLNYNVTTPDPTHTYPDTTDIGSLTGTQTVQKFAVPPDRMLTEPFSPLYGSAIWDYFYRSPSSPTCTGTLTLAGTITPGLGAPSSYSNPYGYSQPYMVWPQCLVENYGSGSFIAQNSPTDFQTYYQRLSLLLSSGAQLLNPSGPGSVSSGANLILQTPDGNVTLPLGMAPSSSSTIIITGSITYNFNNFWTH